MALTRISDNLNIIQALATKIRGQATTVKAAFDSAVNTLKTRVNTMMGEVETQFATKAEVSGVVLGQIPSDTLDESVMAAAMKKAAGGVAEFDTVASHLIDYTLQVPFGGTTTNVSNAYSIATPTIDALAAGMAISVKVNTDSTGAATLNWDSKGDKAIKKANGADVTNLKNGGIYTLRYDGTNFILQGEGASGNATASDLSLGKTATVDAGEITGTGANAKRFASGTITSSATGSTITEEDGSTADKPHVTVSGLTFTPRCVIVKTSFYNYDFFNDGFGTYSKIASSGAGATAEYYRLSGSYYVNGTGFKLPVGDTNTEHNWYAWE